MANDTIFESRVARLSCSAEVFYSFITDIRNFEQFIPAGNIQNWEANAGTCNFRIPPFGSASLNVAEKTPFSYVLFTGNALQDNTFALSVHINGIEENVAEARLSLAAGLNPMMKMMASAPIEKFLEMLISEMEKFDRWNVRFTEK